MDETLSVPHRRDYRIIVVGPDLTTHGGIASVVKVYHSQHASEDPGFEVEMLKTSHYKDGNKLEKLLLVVNTVFRYVGLLFRERRTIVHIHCSFGVSFYRKAVFWLIAKLFGRPIVFHLHASRFYSFFIDARGLRAAMIQTVLGRSDLVIALCTDWKSKLDERYRSLNVRVLHNPIEKRRARITILRSGPLKVLFAAFLIPSKGIVDLIETATQLKLRGVEFELTIVGKGELASWVVQEVARRGIDEQVVVKGWVPEKEIHSLLQKSDVLFLPSYHEGMPMVILEALSFGLPVVATTISGIPDTVVDGYNGFLAEPGAVSDFVERLSRLAADRELLEQLSVNGYAHAERFLVGPIYRELCSEYDALDAAAFG